MSKDEEAEEQIHGKSIIELLEKNVRLPPCVKERSTFMADFEFSRLIEHPYAKSNPDTHGHFRPTPLRYPASVFSCGYSIPVDEGG